MQEKTFNLLDEPWICVLTEKLEKKEVSLIEALVHAQEYKALCGEMATQDVAVLRLLLAVVGTIFYRYDADGKEEELQVPDSDDEIVLERWEEYWRMGRLPEGTIQDYLEEYRERFWLRHPETPFWQVPNLQYGTEYNAGCLLGNVKESMNKATRHHFSMAEGESLSRLSAAEAARWLLHLNAYAVNIKTDKNAPGPGLPTGVGGLGQLGFVMMDRDNLFQTLLLNLCPLKNGTELWGRPVPVWEKALQYDQGCSIAQPDNLPELYTVPYRRIMLKWDKEGYVTGFRAIGGEFYSMEDGFYEPMTLWRIKKTDKKEERKIHIPRLHDPSVYAWREFPALLKKEEEEWIPGLVLWLDLLKEEEILSEKLVTFRMVGMVYGDKMNYTYGDCVHDTLVLSAGLLEKLGNNDWVNHITDEIYQCQAVADEAIRHFSSNLCELLYGNSSAKKEIREALTARYYFLIDGSFREWLARLDPMQKEYESVLTEWEEQSYRCAKQTVEDYVAGLGPSLYTCREKDNKILTVPQLLNWYFRELSRIYPRTLAKRQKEKVGENKNE